MITDRLLEVLRQSRYWTDKTRENGNTIQGLVCPACDDQSAWAYANSPMAICCNKLSQCGARTKTLELFPELRKNIEKDFPATKDDPQRPAREYLRSRAIDGDILNGLDFRYIRNARKTGSGAVLFVVGKDNTGKEVLNGRLFNPHEGDGKTHNIGSTSGKCWRHPGFAYEPDVPTFITEGILDALSLLAIGQQAIAVLSAGQNPLSVDLSFFKRLVISFDPDPAGHKACKKWKGVYSEAEVICCDPGQDWNDLLQNGPPEQVKKLFETNLPRYRNNGLLAIAETAQKYAETWSDFHGAAPGLFTYNGSTYFSEKKISRATGEAFVSVIRCLKATIKVVSFILNRSNPSRPEYVYHLQIQPKGRAIEATATGPDLASPRRLKEWFLTYAKINWEGDAKACTALASRIAEDQKAPEVKQLAVIGYQSETGNYIFGGWAIDTAGKHLSPDKKGHFHINSQHYLPPAHGEGKSIVPAIIGKESVQEIVGLIGEAWGLNGLVALSWTVAGWFINQIKAAVDFYPFISLYGDPASGKSALVTFLNVIQGKDGEGLPITQLNSRKGLTRTIGQISGMFTALLEDSQRNEKGFDYSILLTAYNRGPLQIQAAFSNDLQTKEAPFLGSLLFAQNIEPFNSKQEKQRVVSLEFKTEHITDTSRAAYMKLITLKKEVVAGIILQALANRKHFEEGWKTSFEQAIIDLSNIDERRILENHALILGFYRLFCRCFDIKPEDNVTSFIADLCRKKCISSAIRQTSLADHFFELLDTISEDKLIDTCHFDQEKGIVCVNLPRAENLIRNKGVNLQVNENLSLALQKHPAFIRNGFNYRFPADPEKDTSGRLKQRKVWVFSLDWFIKNETENNATL